MPRYTVILRSTTDARARSHDYIWAADLDAAKAQARQRLHVRREVAHDGHRWNRWEITIASAPTFDPLTLAMGGVDD